MVYLYIMRIKNIVSRVLREEYKNKSVLLEYSDKFIINLIYKYEEQGAQDVEAMEYITLFQRYSPGLPAEDRDILKYSWDELRDLIDEKKSKKKRIKAGKIGDDNDDNIVYEKNGITIYRADSEKECIRYGNGYNFCISSRGDDNYYDRYMKMYGYSTYYFIYNSNLPREDKNHVLVLTKMRDVYYIWDALNRLKQRNYYGGYDEVVKEYYWLDGLKNVFE